MKHKKFLIIAGCLLLLVLLAITAIKIFEFQTSASHDQKPTYSIQRIHHTDDLVESGKIVANDTRLLHNPTGRIDQVNVRDGDHVAKDAVLLTVYDQTVQDQVNEAQNALDKAKQGLNRAITANNKVIDQFNKSTDATERETLQETINKNKDDISDQTRDLQAQQTQLTTLKNKVYQNLLAPFSGILTIVNDEKTGDPVITINSDERHVQAKVTEYDYTKLANEHPAKITAIATDKSQTSVVRDLSQVSDTTDKQNVATYPFRVPVDGRFMYGQSVKVALPQDEIKLSAKAVVTRDKQLFVWQVDGANKAHLQPVNGTKKNGVFVLTTGIKSGARIVTNPDKSLKDGMRVVK